MERTTVNQDIWVHNCRKLEPEMSFNSKDKTCWLTLDTESDVQIHFFVKGSYRSLIDMVSSFAVKLDDELDRFITRTEKEEED